MSVNGSGLVQQIVGYDPDSGAPMYSDGADGFTMYAPDINPAPGRVQIIPEWQGDGMVTPWVDPAWFDTHTGRDYIAANNFGMMASKLGISLAQFLTDPRGNWELFNQRFPQTYSVFSDVISSPVTKMFMIPFAPAILDFVSPLVSEAVPSFVADFFATPIADAASFATSVPGASEAIDFLPALNELAPVAESVLPIAQPVSEVIPVDDVLDFFDAPWTGYDAIDEFGNVIDYSVPVDDAPFNPYAGDAGHTGSYVTDAPDVYSPVQTMPAPSPLPSATPFPSPAVVTAAAGGGLPIADLLKTAASIFKTTTTPTAPTGPFVRSANASPLIRANTTARPLAPLSFNTNEITKFALPAALVIGGLWFLSRSKKGA